MRFVSNACASFQGKEMDHLEQQPNIKLCLRNEKEKCFTCFGWCMVFEWYHNLKDGHELLKDKPCSQQPAISQHDDSARWVQEVVHSDCYQKAEMDAKELWPLIGICPTNHTKDITICHNKVIWWLHENQWWAHENRL